MVNYSPEKLLEYVRDGLVEQEHYGLIVKVLLGSTSESQSKPNLKCESRVGLLSHQRDANKALIAPPYNVFNIGDDKNYPFYLRSCAKPLQASLIIDFGIDETFNMTSEEIALCCASHAGEDSHTQVAKGFLEKIGFDESYMKCGIHKPLSKTERNKLIKEGREENIFQNNCTGKHVMMLAICKKMGVNTGWDVDNYDSPEHPLQIAIKNKIYELCEVGTNYPVTKDGCGVPIYSMPLENMVKGYLNLFLNEKYSKIKDAIINNPYLIGGEDRFDTAAMQTNSNLIVKSGAGGICIVVNLEKKEGFVIKIMDSDMKARAICTIEALKQLGWLSNKMMEHDLIKAQNKTDILTLHGEKIGEAIPCFKLS